MSQPCNLFISSPRHRVYHFHCVQVILELKEVNNIYPSSKSVCLRENTFVQEELTTFGLQRQSTPVEFSLFSTILLELMCVSSTVRLQFPGTPVVVCSRLCLIKSQDPHSFPFPAQSLTLGCAIRLSPNIKGYGSSILKFLHTFPGQCARLWK